MVKKFSELTQGRWFIMDATVFTFEKTKYVVVYYANSHNSYLKNSNDTYAEFALRSSQAKIFHSAIEAIEYMSGKINLENIECL